MMRDNFKPLLVILSLASIIIVLNNCRDFTANNNFAASDNDLINQEEDSIFNNSPSESNTINKNELSGVNLANGIKKVSDKIDTGLYVDTMETFLGLVNNTSTKEDLVNLLKDSDVGLSRPTHIDGLVDKITIKTRKQFNGMKHIRATFISDNGENERFMRLSYDLPKSETALVDAAQILEQSFTDLKREKADHEDQYFIKYLLGEYQLTLRQNFWEDLEGNPFNPYTEEHIGTITVTLEYRRH